MEQKEYRIYDNQNHEFVVSYNNGTFMCKKVEGDTLVDPTKEELEFVIKELERQANNTNKLSIEELLKQIIDMINNNQITNYDELHNYINGLNISEQEKYQLFDKSQGLIKTQTNEKNEIVKLKDELIDMLRKNNDKNVFKIISFDVKSNISGLPLCNINFKTTDNGISKQLKNVTHYYTDELKHELIEPVLQEMILSSRAMQSIEPSDVSFGYRSNLHLQNEENCFAELNNIEQDYAYKLQEEILKLTNETKINDPVARDTRINEIQNEKLNTQSLEKEQQLKRVKKKKMDNNNKGFSNNLILYLLVSIVTVFIVLTQIIILK